MPANPNEAVQDGTRVEIPQEQIDRIIAELEKPPEPEVETSDEPQIHHAVQDNTRVVTPPPDTSAPTLDPSNMFPGG